ncbi:hypothetical protein AVEN_177692-1 [Araneus ventricosus]|uniref:Uncharacterized protein n=1 Tax=Araneus ventricosus TaxID=182803 RepID=A0A4Y2M0Z4_ARAVE|nr:hypothetical protein AVEN_177692-1 [Araneus ventricosus]
MFRKILRTALTRMSKVQEIPRALHDPKTLLDASFNDLATSSTDVEAISFFHLPHFTTNDPDSWNLSIIFFRPMKSSDQRRFLNPLMSGFLQFNCRTVTVLEKGFSSRAPSFSDRVMTTFLDEQ